MPALTGETLIGQVSVANAPRDYTEKDIHIIEHLTALYVLAIERKQAEDALREREENLRLVIQNMPVMLDAFDKDGLIIVWNRECERVTGYRADEIVGNPRAMELLYPDDNYRQQMIPNGLSVAITTTIGNGILPVKTKLLKQFLGPIYLRDFLFQVGQHGVLASILPSLKRH